MNEFKPTKQQQQQFAEQFNTELDKHTMSWDPDLRKWHAVAIASLDFKSTFQLKVPQDKYSRLFETTTHGVNMNVVMVLCNCIEDSIPNEMGVTARDWSVTLQLNDRIAKRWSTLALPVEQSVWKRIMIMASKPSIIKPTMGQA